MREQQSIVYVVDDDEAVRDSLQWLLEGKDYRVKCFDSAESFLSRFDPREVACLIADIRMDGMSGLELQDRLKRMDSILPIVFLTGHGDIPTSVRAIKAGAEDFLSKPVSKDTLLEAVERALARYRDQRDRRDRLDTLRALVSAFTPRESEVFALVVRGRLNKQIAYELGASERTIKAHRHVVMHKLKVASLAEAVSIAERLGMLTSQD